MAEFKADDYRRALGHFATGVAVVTARDRDGEPVGMTVSSFNSVSLDPPLVLFSVARSAHSLEAMKNARGFAINLLGHAQSEMSTRFARAHTDKWSGVGHAPGFGDAPVLDDAIAHFECRPYAQYDGGDHIIFVCEVLRFATASGDDVHPLIFFRGRYRRLNGEEG